MAASCSRRASARTTVAVVMLCGRGICLCLSGVDLGLCFGRASARLASIRACIFAAGLSRSPSRSARLVTQAAAAPPIARTCPETATAEPNQGE